MDVFKPFFSTFLVLATWRSWVFQIYNIWIIQLELYRKLFYPNQRWFDRNIVEVLPTVSCCSKCAGNEQLLGMITGNLDCVKMCYFQLFSDDLVCNINVNGHAYYAYGNVDRMELRLRLHLQNVVQFLLSLTSTSWITYFIFTLASAALAGLTVAFPAIKRKILKNEGEPQEQETKDGRFFFKLCYSLIYSACHIGIMLLIMTYNGGVILAVIAGLAIGYSLYGYEDSDSDLPVNCCANAM